MTPDRMAYLRQCEAEAAAKAYRPEPATDTRTHAGELAVAHTSTTVAGATPASGEGHGPWPRRPI